MLSKRQIVIGFCQKKLFSVQYLQKGFLNSWVRLKQGVRKKVSLERKSLPLSPAINNS